MSNTITRYELLSIRETFLKNEHDKEIKNIIAKVLKDVKNEAKVSYSYNNFFAVNSKMRFFIKDLYQQFQEVFIDCNIRLKIHYEGRLYKDEMHTLEVSINWG